MPHHDVIVIGLGAMGSATAWQLARRNVRVLGLDRWQPPHANGSTHGETRLTRLAVGEGEEYAPFALRSHELWRELEQATGMDLFRQNGLLIYGARGGAPFHGNDDFFGTTVRVAARVFGAERPLLTAAEIALRFPQYLVDTDDVGYYEPEAGMLFPERCVDAQLTLARQHGAEVRTGELVIAVEPLPGGQGVRVRTNTGTHEAATAVVSAGAWVRRFVPARVAHRFVVTRQVLSWFEPDGNAADYLPERMPNFIRLPSSGEPVVYGFPRVSASVADMKVAAETVDSACDPDLVNRTIDSDELSRLYAVASRAVKLRPGATRAVTCLYTGTPASRFVIDRHPDSADVIVVSPCSGHGFKHSAAIGECVAAMVIGERPAIDLSPFGFDRLLAAV